MSKSPIAYVLAFLKLGLGIVSIILCLGEKIVAANFLILGAVFVKGCSRLFTGNMKLTDPEAYEANSLSDMVSFGLSPALTAWKYSLVSLKITGYAILLTFTICSAFQQARNSIKDGDGYYTGMPVTTAGSLLLLDNISTAQFDKHTILTALFMLLLSYLMVCSIRIKKF